LGQGIQVPAPTALFQNVPFSFFRLSMTDTEYEGSLARSLLVGYYFFFIVLFAGFFSPIFMGIIFFIFLNCSSVKLVRISFMAFNISR
jgi:hypothetical protein